MPIGGETAVAPQRGRRPPQILAVWARPARWRRRPRVSSIIAREVFLRCYVYDTAPRRPRWRVARGIGSGSVGDDRRGISWAPDGKRLASSGSRGSDDMTVRIWEAPGT